MARAKEIKTGKVVALKRLKLDDHDSTRSGLPETGLREIQILKDCSHKNIVQLLEVVVGEDTSRIENVFLVLEFVEHDIKSILADMPEPFLAVRSQDAPPTARERCGLSTRKLDSPS